MQNSAYMKEHYTVYMQWYQTLDWIFSTTERFPKFVRFSLASRLLDAALDTMQLIVEAIYTKDRVPLLDRINLLLEQQRVLFRLACDRRYISPNQQEYIARALETTGCMIGGWRKETLAKKRSSV